VSKIILAVFQLKNVVSGKWKQTRVLEGNAEVSEVVHVINISYRQ
jgi:hypothetical protein